MFVNRLAFCLLLSVVTAAAQDPGTVTTVLHLADAVEDVNQAVVSSVDSSGNVYVLDRKGGRILRVSPGGVVTTIAGNGIRGNSSNFGSGLTATSVSIDPAWVARDHSTGGLVAALVTDTGPVNARISPDRIIQSYPFNLENALVLSVFSADQLGATWDRTAASYHLLSDYRIVRFSPEGGVETVTDVPFDVMPELGGFARDVLGNFYITTLLDEGQFGIVRLSPDGLLVPIAGGGEIPVDSLLGPLPASAVQLNARPVFVAAPDGTLYHASTPDSGLASQVGMIDADGMYFPLAGTGSPGYSGDGGPAFLAQFDAPYPIGLDGAGNLYIWDTGNYSIRKISGAYTGTPGSPGISQYFNIEDRSGIRLATNGGGATPRVGYGRVLNGGPGPAPAGFAIFGYRQNGVLISEAGVPAASPATGGRLYAEVNTGVNTGIAIANPNSEPAVISFYYTNLQGADFGHGTITLAPNAQLARFLNDTPFNNFTGVLDGCTFTFTSSVSVSAIALRIRTNERGEPLMTTLPIDSLIPSIGNLTFPHFVDGAGWASQIALVNPSSVAISGSVQFLASVELADGRQGADFRYLIPPRSVHVLRTTGARAEISMGTVRVTPDAGTFTPSGILVFSFVSQGVLITEAGVPGIREGAAFRTYVETSGMDAIRSGIAIANEMPAANMVSFDLTDLAGRPVAGPVWRSVAPFGHLATFIDELFPSVDQEFSGVLRVTGADGPLSMMALRIRLNERGEFLMTTTPPSNESEPAPVGDQFFPQIADSGGWTTQFILFSRLPGSGSGELRLIDQAGDAWEMDFREP